jgi:hypothetical protein
VSGGKGKFKYIFDGYSTVGAKIYFNQNAGHEGSALKADEGHELSHQLTDAVLNVRHA